MTEEEKEKLQASALANAQQRSLELLFDYTKFHIGLYLTLAAFYVTIATAKKKEELIVSLDQRFVIPAVVCFMIAGLAGGIIAAALTEHVGGSSREFMQKTIGPWGGRLFRMKAVFWANLEHTAFWAGLVLAAFSFLLN